MTRYDNTLQFLQFPSPRLVRVRLMVVNNDHLSGLVGIFRPTFKKSEDRRRRDHHIKPSAAASHLFLDFEIRGGGFVVCYFLFG